MDCSPVMVYSMELYMPERLLLLNTQERDWQDFSKHFTGLDPRGVDLLHRAHREAFSAHAGQTRDDGEAYIDHPKAVALILHEECGIVDPEFLAAALLHDTFEDTKAFG